MIKNIFSSVRAVVSVAATMILVGCAPRGEAHTVDQILNDARSSYASTKADVPSDVAPSLTALTGSLDKLAGLGGGGDSRQIAGSAAESLTGLVTKAGFTQRAAMTELISQYRSVAGAQGAPTTLGAPNLKLLVARTYTLLSAELTSTKFRIA